jgi:hypothetical protein
MRYKWYAKQQGGCCNPGVGYVDGPAERASLAAYFGPALAKGVIREINVVAAQMPHEPVTAWLAPFPNKRPGAQLGQAHEGDHHRLAHEMPPERKGARIAFETERHHVGIDNDRRY